MDLEELKAFERSQALEESFEFLTATQFQVEGR